MKYPSIFKTMVVASALVFTSVSAYAATRADSVKALFKQINSTPKGALAKNSYQRPNGRVQVLGAGGVQGAPGDTLFTVAFRNETAAQLAQLDFYVGNHFSSNYWELHNKYLATDAERKALAFHIDQARFLSTPAMASDARSMARHMLLEQFYMRKFSASQLARANAQRGTADADNEKTFYGYFTEYLAHQIATPQDYLNLYAVQMRYNLVGDVKQVSLAKLRDEVASIFDSIDATFPGSALSADFKKIRNSIHNYLTPTVVGELNGFLRTYGASLGGISGRIAGLRDQLVGYYKTDKKTLLSWANKLGSQLPANAIATLNSLGDNSSSLTSLEALSQLMVQSRASFMANRQPDVIHFLIRANQYLQGQLASRALGANEDWVARARITLNAAYAAGVVTNEAYTAATTLLSTPQNDPTYAKACIDQFSQVFVSSQALVRDTMMPALSDWMVIEPSMEGFVDDTLRSSLLTELDQISVYLKKNSPKNNVAYSIEFTGEAVGYLVYVPKGADPAEIGKLDKTMIPIFAELPLDLGVVAGIITEQPQTPLSHINIKSKSRGTPNMYYPKASQDPIFKDLIAKHALVKVTFKDGQVSVRAASQEEENSFLQKMKAPISVDVQGDLRETRVRSTHELHSSDVMTVGAKAANYGEAERVLGDHVMREGMGIPFSFYKEYVDRNMWDAQTTLSQYIEKMVKDPRMKTDRAFLTETLKELQKRMTSKEMVVNPSLLSELQTRLDQLYPSQAVRFRSSTNSEDLPNFSGAGLYDSYAYDPKKPKKSIEKALKDTWASVWNLRAYDEREVFAINHLAVYMGILVSPAFGTELANGVAVTRNIIDPKLGKALYINTQLGENLVTNPDPNETPEELLVLDHPNGKGFPYTLKYVRYSSQNESKPLLTNQEILKLSKYLVAINNHFRLIFDPKRKNPNFAMDVEFKVSDIGGVRDIYLKQARPYVAR